MMRTLLCTSLLLSPASQAFAQEPPPAEAPPPPTAPACSVTAVDGVSVVTVTAPLDPPDAPPDPGFALTAAAGGAPGFNLHALRAGRLARAAAAAAPVAVPAATAAMSRFGGLGGRFAAPVVAAAAERSLPAEEDTPVVPPVACAELTGDGTAQASDCTLSGAPGARVVTFKHMTPQAASGEAAPAWEVRWIAPDRVGEAGADTLLTCTTTGEIPPLTAQVKTVKAALYGVTE